MRDIVKKLQAEIIKRSNEFERLTKGTKDEYNIYKEHIQYVLKYVNILSEGKDVDLEVLQISALLHDIAMTDITLDRSKHNEYSTVIAEELLKENDYSEEKRELVKRCIYNHSNKRKDYRTTLEEQLLVDADCLSHFDSFLDLYSLASKVIGLDEKESINYLQEKLTKDYDEITEESKELIKDRYEEIMNVTTYIELKEIAKSREE